MKDDEGGERRRLVRPPTAGLASGRSKPARLKTASRRTPSSQAWLERQINDPFAAEARAKGYRSRAAFKLTEIDDRLHLIGKGARIIDLGCAPGGWIQAALQRGAGTVVGVDLLPVEPLPPAVILQDDFTRPGCGEELIVRLGGAPDLVLSDMAPNTMGHRKTDHLRIIALVEAAAAFAIQTLKPGGAFVSKAFQGGETAEVLKLLKANFAAVRHFKPKSSRSESAEVYLVATGFKGRS
jgi:23S rRNA (uridine2552-2'-O)-methyltransferase